MCSCKLCAPNHVRCVSFHNCCARINPRFTCFLFCETRWTYVGNLITIILASYVVISIVFMSWFDQLLCWNISCKWLSGPACWLTSGRSWVRIPYMMAWESNIPRYCKCKWKGVNIRCNLMSHSFTCSFLLYSQSQARPNVVRLHCIIPNTSRPFSSALADFTPYTRQPGWSKKYNFRGYTVRSYSLSDEKAVDVNSLCYCFFF